VVAEGDSEVGFVREILERTIDKDLLKFGIWVNATQWAHGRSGSDEPATG
jgi:hypothetical protein